MKKYTAIITLLAAMLLSTPALSATQPVKAPELITLKGEVRNSDGKPIPKALIYVKRHSQKGWDTIKLRADSKGNYVKKLPMKGFDALIRIIAVADGYAYQSEYVDGRCDSDCPKMKLFPARPLRGQIVDEFGKPLPGAKVRISQCYAYGAGKEADMRDLEDLCIATTGKDGMFVFNHMLDPDGFQNINVGLSIYKPGRAEINKYMQKSDFAKSLVIKDPLECKIDGVLYLPDKSGTAPEGTALMAIVSADGETDTRYASCDKEGKFQFTKLPPGKVKIMLSAQYPSYSPEGRMTPSIPKPWALAVTNEIEILPKEVKPLEIVLTTGALVKGKVIDAKTDKPVAGAILAVNHDGAPAEWVGFNIVATNENGEFEARVVGGVTSFYVQQVHDPENPQYYGNDSKSSVSLIVADKEVKTDVMVKLNREDKSSYRVQEKPVPVDFEVKAGEYDLVWDENIDSNESYPKYADDAKSRVKKLPEFKSAKARVFAIRLDGESDDGQLFVALDESGGTGKKFDTAYIDANRNGDLTDDSTVAYVIQRDYDAITTDWVRVKSHQGKGDASVSNMVQVSLRIYTSPDAPQVALGRRGGWKGSIDSNKGQIQCAVIDATFNGIYGDISGVDEKLQPSSQPDELYVDNNGFGRAVVYPWGPHRVNLYKVCKIAEKFYNVQVNATGNKLTIQPYTGELGKLDLQCKGINDQKATAISLNVTGENGVYAFTGVNGKPIVLPAGNYAINNCVLNLGADNKPLQIVCNLDSACSVASAAPGCATIGGKLSMGICSGQKELKFTSGKNETIEWNIKIGDKTTVSSLGVDRRENPPTVKFYNKNGKLIHKTAAGYT